MDKRKKKSRRYLWLFLGGMVIGATIAVIGIIRKSEPNKTPSVPQSTMSADKVRDVVTRTRAALGHLENDRFSDADKLLTVLLGEVPDEPIIVRNLMIARLRLFEEGKLEESQVQQAFEALRKAEAGAASTSWLAAKIKLKQAEAATT